ncbi:MAG TPA: hypothetical protein VHN80_32140 [Kineosporiaceae bacterium]|nr:hypothetical protein [Kineosporiaceae bacterium]
MSLEEFFLILDRRNVPYVVLRWFDQLPHVDPGEDVDILVADEHLEFVHTLLRARPLRRDSQAFDVYSVSGLPGSDFSGVPYYPPRFARAVLADAVRFRGLYRVPSLEHHFQSLSYHALYHKGYSSGLRADTDLGIDGTGAGDDSGGDRAASDHDYEAVLAGLAEQLATPMVPTLDTLDLALADQGLRPPMDTLERLAPENAWIHDRFFTGLPDIDAWWRGLAVFVVRERAREHVALIQQELGRHGFEILEVVRLDAAQQDAASHHIRGGNWERGPWPVSGGGPSDYVIAYDVAPQFEATDEGPGTNLRIPEAKAKVRERLLQGLDPRTQYNPLHSSDNPRQALEHLDLLADPELMARLGGRARALMDACAVPFPLLRYLAPGAPARRARVALVDHPVHGPSVCKIYRPGAHRFFERELRARKELGDLPEVPDLLDHGDNWLLTPFYQDDRRQVLRRLPFAEAFDNEVQFRPEATRAMAGFVRALHERGLFILDLSSENVITDPVAGLKVLDLEFLQEYAGHPPTLSGCYSVRGVPPQDRGSYDEPQDVPLAACGGGSSVFHPAVAGLPFSALLRRQRPADLVRRPVTQLTWYLRLGVTRGYLTARSSLGGSRWGRRSRRLVAIAVALRHRPT